MSDSSDEDSFHSASDGEKRDLEEEQSTASSLDTKASSAKTTKESNDDFEKVEKPAGKDDTALFKVPELPAPRMRKNSAKTASSSSLTKSTVIMPENSSKPAADDDEEDDWFKTQMDELHQRSGAATINEKARPNDDKQRDARCLSSASGGDEDKSVKKSIWDWTGIHDVVTAVGEGLSSAVEVGLGLPPAEELARLSVAERRKLLEEAQHMKEPEPSLSSDEGLTPAEQHHGLFRAKKSYASRQHQQAAALAQHAATRAAAAASSNAGERGAPQSAGGGVGGFFSTGGLFSNLVTAPLDALESLGKKTFETLTVKEQGDEKEKRRFFLRGTDASEGQSLSQILRELRDNETQAKADAGGAQSGGAPGQRSLMGRQERFDTNFVSLFEKNEGMVHLEGLELLSRDQERRTKGLVESREFNEALNDFCVEDVSECSTEDFDKEFAKSVNFISLPFKPDDVLETNRSLTQELTLRQAAVDATEQIVVEAIHEAAITALARLTAHSISSLHKIAQLIVIAKQLPEVDSLVAFAFLLCRRLSFFATQYCNILNVVETSKEVDEVVTNIFFECSNACHDVKKALELVRPFFKKQR